MSTYTGLLDRIAGALDELTAIGPEFRTSGERRELLVGLSRLVARTQAEQLRVLACSADIAEETGDRSTDTWLATQTRDAQGTLRRNAALARSLEARWTQVARAFAAGKVNLAQVRVISDALEALPRDLGSDLLVKAEMVLVEEAGDLGPKDLAVVGARILQRVAPDLADEHDYQQLLAAERRANAATKLNGRRRGDGSADIHARVPDHVYGRLLAYLKAFNAPRRRHLHNQQTVDTPFGPVAPAEPDELANLPLERQRGIAFVALLHLACG